MEMLLTASSDRKLHSVVVKVLKLQIVTIYKKNASC